MNKMQIGFVSGVVVGILIHILFYPTAQPITGDVFVLVCGISCGLLADRKEK